MSPRRCPCGTGLPYPECCGRLHDRAATAATAEQLMRSRYSAFAVGDAAVPARDLAPRHPAARAGARRRRPLDRARRPRTTGGSLLAADGTVEFRASYVRAGRAGAQHENSRFVREDGQWRYLDGVSLG